jgi:RimJ/RimL family protein N-acetyltransferase
MFPITKWQLYGSVQMGLGPASWAAEEVDTLGFNKTLVTTRLEVRPPCEADRDRFIELFCDHAFMIFSSGTLTEDGANRRFDHMLAMCEVIPFAKQPIVERETGAVVGYTGVDYFTFEGEERLEWGYRLAPEARGMGYATEASRALLLKASESFDSEVLAIVDPANSASQRVARKLGFAFWKQATVDGYLDNIYRLHISSAGAFGSGMA